MPPEVISYLSANPPRRHHSSVSVTTVEETECICSKCETVNYGNFLFIPAIQPNKAQQICWQCVLSSEALRLIAGADWAGRLEHQESDWGAVA